MRTKMLEARFHEEKLRLQQKHDSAVQKVLKCSHFIAVLFTEMK